MKHCFVDIMYFKARQLFTMNHLKSLTVVKHVKGLCAALTALLVAVESLSDQLQLDIRVMQQQHLSAAT